MQEKSKAPNDVSTQTFAAAPAERHSQDLLVTQQTGPPLRVTLITNAIGLLYWPVVILAQRGRTPILRQAAVDEGA
jgi:hypothetical protein